MSAAQIQNTPWLESPRLRLREFTPTDGSRLMEMHQNPRLTELLIDQQPFEQRGFTSAFIRRMIEIYREYEGLGIWAAERMRAILGETELNDPVVREMLSDEALETYSKPRPEFVGWFNLMPVPHDQDEIELGSRLVPAVWGAGLAIEGGERLLAHAFDNLNREQVWAFSLPGHRAVHFCVHTLGFEDCGIGSYADQHAQVYKIKRSHWQDWRQRPRKQRMRHAVKVCKRRNDVNDLIPLKRVCVL